MDERAQLIADSDQLVGRMRVRLQETFTQLEALAQTQDEDGLRELVPAAAPFSAEVRALDVRLQGLLAEGTPLAQGVSA